MPFSSPILPDEHLWEADGTANLKYISWVHVEKMPSCWYFGTMPCGIHGWWETQMLPENSWRGNSPSVSGGPGKAAAAAAGFVGRCPTGILAGNASWAELLLSYLNHPFLQLHFNGLHGHCLAFWHWMVRGPGTATAPPPTFRYSSGPIRTEAGGQQSSGKGAETTSPAHKANKTYQRVKILCSSYCVGFQGSIRPCTTWLVLKGTFLLLRICQTLCE